MNRIEKITQKQIIENGVQALADRPNAPARYGVGGKSPQALKEWFDGLSKLLADKINEICGVIESDDAATYIRIALDDYGVGTLQELVTAMVDGSFAESILQVLPSGSAVELQSLQTYINGVAASISGLNNEKLDKEVAAADHRRAYTIEADGEQSITDISESPRAGAIPIYVGDGQINVAIPVNESHAANKGYVDERSASKIELTVDSSTFNMTLALKNSRGDILSTATFDLPFESVVMGGSYKDGVLTLELKEGAKVEINVSDIVDGLVNEKTFNDGIGALNEQIAAQKNACEKKFEELNQRIDQERKYQNNTFANALKGEVSGEVIGIDDVSPIEHEMDVKVKSKNLYFNNETAIRSASGLTAELTAGKSDFILNGTATASQIMTLSTHIPLPAGTYTVSLYGTNIIDKNRDRVYLEDVDSPNNTVLANGIISGSPIEFTIKNDTNVKVKFVFANGTSYENALCSIQIEEGTTATNYVPYFEDLSEVKVNALGKNLLYISADKTVTVGGVTMQVVASENKIIVTNTEQTAAASVGGFSFSLPAGTYTFSVKNSMDRDYLVVQNKSTNSYYPNITADIPRTITLTETTNLQFSFVVRADTTATYNNTEIFLQCEVGDKATAREAYKEPIEYAVNADGTVDGLKSIYPNMSIVPDTSGVAIDVKYNRDINKAIAELINAIISLGGNV